MSKGMDEGRVDEVLVRQAQRGDPAAFIQLATRWWAPVSRLAWNMLGTTSEATEATERVLLRALRFPGLPERGVSFGNSLYRAVIDGALQKYPESGRSGVGSLDARFDIRGDVTAVGADWADLADRRTQRPDLANAMRRKLQRLDRMDRAAFLLREIEQLSIEETVAILRIPADEVRARTHGATLLMTRLLGRMLASREQWV